jgi:hypothetical protein
VPGFFVPLWEGGFYERVIAGLKRPVLLFAGNVKNTGGVCAAVFLPDRKNTGKGERED